MKKIAILLLISGCSFIDEPHYEVDSRLQPFVDQFFIEAELRGIFCKPENLIVRIKPLQDNYAGLTVHNTIKTVYIDESYYNDQIRMSIEAPDRAQYFLRAIEETIFHELGHAVLGLGHIEKGGIMGVYSKSVHKYCDDDAVRDSMINDLFYEGK